MDISSPLPHQKTLILRGLCERCPQCGKGRVFDAYLKQSAACSACGEDLSYIRADDGPAWLTILLTLHVVVTTAVMLANHDIMPQWADISFLLALTLGCVFFFLPRAKGIFIAELWLIAQKRKREAAKLADPTYSVP